MWAPEVQLAARPEAGAMAATTLTTAMQRTIRTRFDGFCVVVPMMNPLSMMPGTLPDGTGRMQV